MERSEGGKACMHEKQRLDAEAFGEGYRRNVMLCFFPSLCTLTTASLDWVGHNHNNWQNNNLWIFESMKCGLLQCFLHLFTEVDAHHPPLPSCPYTSVPLIFLLLLTITCSLVMHTWNHGAVLQLCFLEFCGACVVGGWIHARLRIY